MLPERMRTRWDVSCQLTRKISTRGVIEQAGGEIVLVQAVGAQGAGNVEAVDVEADAVLQFAGGEAGGGLESGAVEGRGRGHDR